MKKIFVITVLSVIAGCVSLKLKEPSISEIDRMRQKVPGITYAEAVKGFHLYKSKCNGCHGLHRPNEFTKQGWEHLLPEMLAKAKLYDSTDKKNLVDYLIANSK